MQLQTTIEITPEMIAAGTTYITHSLALIEPIISSEDDLAEFACSLYKAMASMSPEKGSPMQPDETTIRLLRKIRSTLQGYADNHLGKTPPQPEKAATNITLVHEINDALLSLAQPLCIPLLTEEATEAVRDSDSLKPGIITWYPVAGTMHIPSLVHLTKFVETFEGRDDEDYVAISIPIGDLRALVGSMRVPEPR